MKILHVIEGIDSKLGGLPFALINIRAMELEIGIVSDVLSIRPDNEYNENSNNFLFVKSFPRRFCKSKDANSWLKLDIKNYDLLVIHGIWYFLAFDTIKTAIGEKKQFIIWPHGSLDPFDLRKKYLLKYILGKLVLNRYLNEAKCVCLTSKLESDKLNTFGSNVKKVILHLPVEPIKELCSNKFTFRKNYSLNDTDFVLLFLGRLNYKKNLEPIIKVILESKNENLKLAIVGNYQTGYGKKISNLAMSNEKIIFCGELLNEQKIAAFKESNCFILPSFNENFGIAVIESLQYSLPVIISENVYIWNEVIMKGGGWICGTDKLSINKVINTIIEDTLDYNVKRENARNAGEQFLIKNLKNKYNNLYDYLKIN